MARILTLFLISTFSVLCFWLIKLIYERPYYIKHIKQLKQDVQYLKQELKSIK